jgi:hypothetical protein
MTHSEWYYIAQLYINIKVFGWFRIWSSFEIVTRLTYTHIFHMFTHKIGKSTTYTCHLVYHKNLMVQITIWHPLDSIHMVNWAPADGPSNQPIHPARETHTIPYNGGVGGLQTWGMAHICIQMVLFCNTCYYECINNSVWLVIIQLSHLYIKWPLSIFHAWYMIVLSFHQRTTTPQIQWRKPVHDATDEVAQACNMWAGVCD